MVRWSSLFLFSCLMIFFSTREIQGASDKFRLTWNANANPATYMVIGWNAVSGNQHRVYYDTIDHGTDTTSYSFLDFPDVQYSHKGMNNTFVRLTGLQPDTRYYFVVADDQGVSQRFWFKTLPNDPDHPLYFIAGGDSRNNRNIRQNANKLVSKLKPDAVFFAGDMTSLSTDGQWQDWFDDWQSTIGQNGRMTPIVPARGNHEFSNDALHYLFDTNSDVYYGLTFGGGLFRMYTLNTEVSILGNQTTWFQNDLSNQGSVIWKAAQYHRPIRPHVASKSENNDSYSAWADLFYQEGVRLVMECDAHACKNTWPVRPSTGTGSEEGFRLDSTSGYGTVYSGEGCWGAPIRNNDDAKSWTRNSGKFNQFKWIRVDKARIRIRTVKVDNADMVGSIPSGNRYVPPQGLEIWEPSEGEEVVIKNDAYEPPRVSFLSPQNSTHFNVPQQFTLRVDAWDPDGVVDSVCVFLNGQKMGTDTVPPFEFDLKPSGEGSYEYDARAYDDDGIMGQKPIFLTFGDDPIRTSVMIGDANDDAEEASGGGMDLSSSDIELVNDMWTGSGDQTVGLRFNEVKVPNGANVDSAFVQFTTDSDNNGGTSLWLTAEDTTDSPFFENVPYNISSRSFVSDSVSWTPPAWNVSGERGVDQRSPDLAPVVQKVIDRPGWKKGKALSIITMGSGVRTAVSYDNASDHPAELIVYYSLPTSGNGEIPPEVNLVAPYDGKTIPVGQSISLEATSQDQDGTVQKVDFLVDGNLVGSDQSAPYTISWQPGSSGYKEVQAKATDDDGNSTITSIHILKVQENTSLQERKLAKGFKVYPTPFTNRLYVDLPEGKISRDLILYNSNGELVREFHPARGRTRMTLLLDQLPSGAYYLVLEEGNEKVVRKVLK